MERKEGFYWVNFDGDWIIAKWSDGFWAIGGFNDEYFFQEYFDDDFIAIDESEIKCPHK